MGKQAEVREQWRERVGAQESSRLSVRAYCKEHGIGEHSFYAWRQRLKRESETVSFALVEAKPERRESADRMAELLLPGGERLRIPCEETALTAVLRAMRHSHSDLASGQRARVSMHGAVRYAAQL